MKNVIGLVLFIVGVSYAQPCEADERAITHEYGTTCIPGTPERIVTLSEEVAELVAVLGEKPVGHATRRPVSTAVGETLSLDTPLAEALSEAAFLLKLNWEE
jgi:ABC-type Fe3+-hydroxamate transport system substrate-binding protein